MEVEKYLYEIIRAYEKQKVYKYVKCVRNI